MCPACHQEWYAAKSVYRHHSVSDGSGQGTFEERVVLLRASNVEDAIARAETEAMAYCGADGGITYLNFVDVFHLIDDIVGDGTEIYSLVRESDLSDDGYLERFYDSGSERSRPVGGAL